MRRRDFITLIGSAAMASPLAARAGRAQQGERTRRLAVLLGTPKDNPASQAQFATFRQALAELQWEEGRNIRLELRFTAGDIQRMRAAAEELIALQPDAILSVTTPATLAVQKLTQTIPIVFVNASDPIGDGIVTSLARPGGNITGFINVEASMAGKWLELLRDIAPGLRRAAVLINPDTAPGGGEYFTESIKAAATSFKLAATIAAVRTGAEVENLIESLGREPTGGLIVAPGGAFARVHHNRILELTARHKVPTTYPDRSFTDAGGLLSYGPDYPDLYRRAAGYMDRIFRGTKPADLPVQVPTKFELVINLRAAKQIGLTVPPMLLARADEVIE